MVQNFCVSERIVGHWGKPKELFVKWCKFSLTGILWAQNENFNTSDEVFLEFVLENVKLAIPLQEREYK
jgi:hypothetical protein